MGNKSKRKARQGQKQAITELSMLPTFALVSVLDNICKILINRGEIIRDWDYKTRSVKAIKCIGGKPYFLVTSDVEDINEVK